MNKTGNFQYQPKSEQEREVERQVQQARSSAIRFIGLSRKSSGRVIDFLRREGFEQVVIDQTLADLRADQYIDDERLARRQARSRTGTKAESGARLAQRLSQGGLDAQAVQVILEEKADDRTCAREALVGRFGRPGCLTGKAGIVMNGHPADEGNGSEQDATDPATLRTAQNNLNLKMQRFLASRGFSAEVTREAIREFWKGYMENNEDT